MLFKLLFATQNVPIFQINVILIFILTDVYKRTSPKRHLIVDRAIVETKRIIKNVIKDMELR